MYLVVHSTIVEHESCLKYTFSAIILLPVLAFLIKLLTGYQVYYVDYGNMEWLGLERIRQMEPRFMRMPFQEVHCHLPVSPSHIGWSEEAVYVYNLTINLTTG